jgi:hypothetical protein
LERIDTRQHRGVAKPSRRRLTTVAEESDNQFLELFTQVTNSNDRMVAHTEQLVAIHGDVRTLIEQLGGLVSGSPTSPDSAPVAQGVLGDVRFNYLRMRGQLGHDRAMPTAASAVVDREREELRFEGPAAAKATLAIFWMPDLRSPVEALIPREIALASKGGQVTCPLDEVRELVGRQCELRDRNGTRVAVVAWPDEVLREV